VAEGIVVALLTLFLFLYCYIACIFPSHISKVGMHPSWAAKQLAKKSMVGISINNISAGSGGPKKIVFDD
jgi:hypothetical protein